MADFHCDAFWHSSFYIDVIITNELAKSSFFLLVIIYKGNYNDDVTYQPLDPLSGVRKGLSGQNSLHSNNLSRVRINY